MFRPLAAIAIAIAIAGAGVVALLVPAARAQEAVPPTVKLIVPFPADGSTDVTARIVASQLGPWLGTNVIIENRAGGASLIGSGTVAGGPTDGSMLLFTSNSLITAAANKKSMPFDVNKDFVSVAMVAQGPMAIGVGPKNEVKSVSDLMAAARANPNGLTYGTSGVGTFLHLVTEWMNNAGGVQTNHIPYKGAAPAAADVAAGTIDFMIAARASIVPHVQARRVRLIAVTSEQPSAAFPGLPPAATVAPVFSAESWNFVLAPTGAPKALVKRLNLEINAIAKTAEMRRVMDLEGAAPGDLTPDEVAARLRESVEFWKKLVTAKNIEVE